MNRRERFANLLHERASGLVHRADWLYMALVLMSGTSWFLPRTLGIKWLSILLSALVLGAALFQREHGARLCERCVTQFAINAPEHAARHRRRFQAFHHYYWFLLPTLVPLMLAPFLDAPWKGIAYLPNVLALVLLALLVRFHGSYQPWCPYCDDRGHGDGESEISPGPTGGHGRPLPVA